MPHPLMTPDAQAKLATNSFDDQIAGILFANRMTARLPETERVIFGVQSVIYWLIARGAVLPPAVLAEVDEWNPPNERSTAKGN